MVGSRKHTTKEMIQLLSLFLTGSDFIGSVQSVTFSAGTHSESVLVFIIDDEEYEGTEDFYAILTTDDTRVDIFQPNANVTIVDDGKRFTISNLSS